MRRAGARLSSSASTARLGDGRGACGLEPRSRDRPAVGRAVTTSLPATSRSARARARRQPVPPAAGPGQPEPSALAHRARRHRHRPCAGRGGGDHDLPRRPHRRHGCFGAHARLRLDRRDLPRGHHPDQAGRRARYRCRARQGDAAGAIDAGVAAARALAAAETAKLLEPWLGVGVDVSNLPVPRLVVVTLVPEAERAAIPR